MNAEIEHSSPYGKDSGEKVPGQKRKLGPAAMRAWMRRRRKTGEKPPSADDVKQVVGDTPPEREAGAPMPKRVERERVQEAAQAQAKVQEQEEKAKERVH
jgi:hypothetical protein